MIFRGDTRRHEKCDQSRQREMLRTRLSNIMVIVNAILVSDHSFSGCDAQSVDSRTNNSL